MGNNRCICPECSKCYPNNKALQRHLRDQHKRKLEPVVDPGRHLKGICVDFERGIFMISCTFSGTMHPIHCVHKTHTPYDAIPATSSCEINECMDAARVARQSGHPAFECIHLQSTQYALPFKIPVALRDDALEEIAGGQLKWIIEKQKNRIELFLFLCFFSQMAECLVEERRPTFTQVSLPSNNGFFSSL